MPFDIKLILEKKKSLIALTAQNKEWEILLSSVEVYLSKTPISLTDVQELAIHAPTPHSFLHLMRLIYHFHQTHPSENKSFYSNILQTMQNSSFPVSEWIEALSFFYIWLEKKERSLNLKKMLAYINCCLEAPEVLPVLPSLKDLLEQFLETYGFLG